MYVFNITARKHSPFSSPYRHGASRDAFLESKVVREENRRLLLDRIHEAIVGTAIAYNQHRSSHTLVRAQEDIFRGCLLHSDPEHNNQNLLEVAKRCYADPTLVSCRSAALNNYSRDGYTPLHCAAYRGNINMIRVLLAGFDQPPVINSDGTLLLSDQIQTPISRTAADPWSVDLQVTTCCIDF